MLSQLLLYFIINILHTYQYCVISLNNFELRTQTSDMLGVEPPLYEINLHLSATNNNITSTGKGNITYPTAINKLTPVMYQYSAYFLNKASTQLRESNKCSSVIRFLFSMHIKTISINTVTKSVVPFIHRSV